MNECVNLENVGRVEELLAMTEQMQDELDQKDQTILELNRQLEFTSFPRGVEDGS